MSGHGARADSVWLDARVRTMDPARPFAEAIAVRDGRVIAVGTNSDALALSGADTSRHSLAGRAVLPGLVDTHMHPIWGAVRDLFEVYVGLGATLEDLLTACERRANEPRAPRRLIGGPWQKIGRAHV